MGRVKIPIARINNSTSRQITYTKRRSGLFKKAYELAVLSDVDVALIAFSPSGQLSHFSSHTRIEDVLSRFINLPDHERGMRIENQANLLEVLGRLKCDDMAAQQAASRNRFFYMDLEQQKPTPIEFEERERMLMRILAEINKRKNVLLRKCISPDESSSSSPPNLSSGSFLQPQQEVLSMQPQGTYTQPPKEELWMQPPTNWAYLQLQQDVLNLQETPEAEGFQLKAGVRAVPANDIEPDPCLIYLRDLDEAPEAEEFQLEADVPSIPASGIQPADPSLLYPRDSDVPEIGVPSNEQHSEPPMLNFGSLYDMAWDPYKLWS